MGGSCGHKSFLIIEKCGGNSSNRNINNSLENDKDNQMFLK